MRISTPKEKLEDHVKRICRSNLKKPCKICIKCPFIYPILDIMEKHGWKYNKKGLGQTYKNYKNDSHN